MRTLIIKGGKYGNHLTVVDEKDFAYLSQFCWYFHKGYARRLVWKGSPVLMHREILGLKNSRMCVDHVNGNPLDNRRLNLRIASRSQNAKNQRTRPDNTSGYKGVSWHERLKMWKTQIQVNKNKKHLGVFNSKEEAYMIYVMAEEFYYGKFARTSE